MFIICIINFFSAKLTESERKRAESEQKCEKYREKYAKAKANVRRIRAINAAYNEDLQDETAPSQDGDQES